jgi:serine/threonine-protein kinase HipA
VGQSQIGRLTFGEKKDIPAIELDEILKYHGTQDLFESLLNRYITCSGISGAQPKIMVRVAESSSSNLERITHKSATHIVKTWDAHDYPELAFNEYFCMLAAKYSQLEVPEFYLSDNRKFFVIQRFDIQDGSYLGFEDFCVLNAFGTQQKYDSSYERICKRIKEFVSPSEMLVSLESFYKSLVLSCIVKNGDAHLKNFGVLYSDTESIVKLAPVYDIVSTTPYLAEDTLALTLDGSKRWPNQKKLLTFAVNHCGISKQRAQELIDRVSDGVFIALQELKQYASTRQELSDIGELIGNAWESGLSLTNPSKLLPK